MPVLPSGRRVEFSLDRFHALLGTLGKSEAANLVSVLCDPDDLLYILDAVHFSQSDQTPFFADYLAADWRAFAAEWSTADRESLQRWMVSPDARAYRAEAIRYLRAQWLDSEPFPERFPYVLADTARMPSARLH